MSDELYTADNIDGNTITVCKDTGNEISIEISGDDAYVIIPHKEAVEIAKAIVNNIEV